MMFKFEQNRPGSICVGSIICIALAPYKDDNKTHTPFYRQTFQRNFLNQKFKQASSLKTQQNLFTITFLLSLYRVLCEKVKT